MTLKQFNHMDETEQGEAVWDHGVLLGNFREDPFRYILYQIDSFYVELRYHQDHNVLTGIRAFDDTNELEPYMEQIKLHQEMGYPTATVKELRDKALQLLPTETIQQIIDQERDGLVILNYSVGLHLRNHMNLWHAVINDEQGKRLYPDDVTLRIIEEIWELNNQ
jgi:hypothetical protein